MYVTVVKKLCIPLKKFPIWAGAFFPKKPEKALLCYGVVNPLKVCFLCLINGRLLNNVANNFGHLLVFVVLQTVSPRSYSYKMSDIL
jgi:hypothetical protein